MSTAPTIMTVPQAAARLRNEGVPVGEYRLRLWAKDGTIPSVQCGRKTLVNYDRLVDFLNGGGAIATNNNSGCRQP